MKIAERALAFATGCLMILVATSQVWAEEPPGRRELRRADLSGAPGLEVILSVQEWNPGDEIDVHFHHGIEAGYFLEGGTIQAPGKPPSVIAAGQPIWNLRDVTHAGFRVIGEKPLKLVTVHVIDKVSRCTTSSSNSKAGNS